MLIVISRKGRKGRRTSNANYAIAEVVAGYARQRAQRQNRNEDEDENLLLTTLRTLVVTKFATTPAQACNTKGNKSLRSLRSLREKNNHREKRIYFTQIPQNPQEPFCIEE